MNDPFTSRQITKNQQGRKGRTSLQDCYYEKFPSRALDTSKRVSDHNRLALSASPLQLNETSLSLAGIAELSLIREAYSDS